MKKKTIILWSVMSVFLSACVYLTFPKESSVNTADKSNEKEYTELQSQTDLQETSDEIDLEAIVDAYFATRPVREIPKEADFSSFLIGTFAKINAILKKQRMLTLPF